MEIAHGRGITECCMAGRHLARGGCLLRSALCWGQAVYTLCASRADGAQEDGRISSELTFGGVWSRVLMMSGLCQTGGQPPMSEGLLTPCLHVIVRHFLGFLTCLLYLFLLNYSNN